jgi:23S rRNA-/tRNA-specific pseudouridylate synthase
MKEFVFVVDKQFNSIKPLDFLSRKGVSDEIIKKVKFGGVFINGEVLKNSNERIGFGDKVKIVLPKDEPNPYIVPIKAPLDVIYEDEYLIAVNKPKGMLTHSSRHNNMIALDQVVCGYFLPQDFTYRAINRLDRDTSGIVLIAKDAYTASLLGDQIKEGKMQKTYSAVVVGEPSNEHFIIEKPIKRQNPNSMKRTCAEDGKYSKREGDVCGHRDGYASLHGCICRAEKPEQQHRNHHSAARSDDRKHCLFQRRKLTYKDFTLDLQTDRQEEDRHQEVIDDHHHIHRMTSVAEQIEVSH